MNLLVNRCKFLFKLKNGDSFDIMVNKAKDVKERESSQ